MTKNYAQRNEWKTDLLPATQKPARENALIAILSQFPPFQFYIIPSEQ